MQYLLTMSLNLKSLLLTLKKLNQNQIYMRLFWILIQLNINVTQKVC
ncbi:ORF047 [Staphylococcus phage 66]|uniref:ORF047 n=1 Tax=Staphylococcus phage 66 TaxID=320832 RepID=Q4ZE62_9CAUD|nr:ORF047 [Staphylococcus phage 66]AAX90676.1 ORF047 [Staphylococcus phage 66]